jgi:anti-sigma B factor antagonist
MSLRVETSKIEPDIVVVHLAGSMTIGPETDSLESVVRDRVERGDKKLVFELSGVERIDSVGGMALIRCFFIAREADARLCLAGASHAVERLFRATHVDTLIPFFSTTDAACEHFTGSRQSGG